MTHSRDPLAATRRHFLSDCPMGLAGMALATMESKAAPDRAADPMALRPTHHEPKAKSVKIGRAHV